MKLTPAQKKGMLTLESIHPTTLKNLQKKELVSPKKEYTLRGIAYRRMHRVETLFERALFFAYEYTKNKTSFNDGRHDYEVHNEYALTFTISHTGLPVVKVVNGEIFTYNPILVDLFVKYMTRKIYVRVTCSMVPAYVYEPLPSFQKVEVVVHNSTIEGVLFGLNSGSYPWLRARYHNTLFVQDVHGVWARENERSLVVQGNNKFWLEFPNKTPEGVRDTLKKNTRRMTAGTKTVVYFEDGQVTLTRPLLSDKIYTEQELKEALKANEIVAAQVEDLP